MKRIVEEVREAGVARLHVSMPRIKRKPWYVPLHSAIEV